MYDYHVAITNSLMNQSCKIVVVVVVVVVVVGRASSSRGIYFAEKSAYSHKYAFHPKANLTPEMKSWQERPDFMEQDREIFLNRLLVGNEFCMNLKESCSQKAICRELRVPPKDPVTGLKYNTVRGEQHQSQIWVVYENGRAYPDYLVRYYVSPRDPLRTPFEHPENVSDPSQDQQELSLLPVQEQVIHPLQILQPGNVSHGVEDLEAGIGEKNFMCGSTLDDSTHSSEYSDIP
jgi:hypothetical protein